MIWALAALATSLAIAVTVTPWVTAVARRLGVVARPNPDVPSHVAVVPLLGGVAIALGLAPWLAVAVAHDVRWASLAAGLALVAALGAYKDRVEVPVSPVAQLAVQTVAMAILWLGGFRLEVASNAAVDLALTTGLAIMLLNAWNFLDIMDGLAASVAAASLPFFAAVGIAHGDVAIAVIAAALAGGALGYVRYNWPPARLFMGDIGSFVIGLTFVALVLAAKRHAHGDPAVVLAVAVPVADFLFTVASRVVAGKSPMQGGDEHVALRLAARGWSTRRIDLAACAVAVAGGAAAWIAIY